MVSAWPAKTTPATPFPTYLSDHLKTASVITDSAGNIKSESDYYPWGGELQFSSNDPNHYKFTGKERDAEAGLDYFTSAVTLTGQFTPKCCSHRLTLATMQKTPRKAPGQSTVRQGTRTTGGPGIRAGRRIRAAESQ